MRVLRHFASRARFFPAFLIFVIAATGCQTLGRRTASTPPPPPQNYFNPGAEGPSMRRVAMLPLFYDQRGTATLGDIENSFHAELTKTARFEIVHLSRHDMEEICGLPQVSSADL